MIRPVIARNVKRPDTQRSTPGSNTRYPVAAFALLLDRQGPLKSNRILRAEQSRPAAMVSPHRTNRAGADVLTPCFSRGNS